MTDLNALAERLETWTEADAYEAPWTFGEVCKEAAQALRGMGEALKPFADAGAAIDVAPFGEALFASNATAFSATWSTNGEVSRLTWGDFRRARSALKGGGSE